MKVVLEIFRKVALNVKITKFKRNLGKNGLIINAIPLANDHSGSYLSLRRHLTSLNWLTLLETKDINLHV